MQKKHLIIIAIMLVISFMVAGCGSGGDISTRIVGHWGYFEEGESDPGDEIYIGEFDEEGISQCFYIEDEYTSKFVLKIIEENSSSLVLRETLPSVGLSETVTVQISEDGQRLTYNEFVLHYIDSETEP